jgi:RHS repeat-associated protein
MVLLAGYVAFGCAFGPLGLSGLVPGLRELEPAMSRLLRVGRRGLAGVAGRGAAAAAVAGLLASVLTAAMPPPAYTGKLWSPFPLAAAKSVPGVPMGAGAARVRAARLRAARVREPGALTAVRFSPGGTRWPSAGQGTATLATARRMTAGLQTGPVLLVSHGWKQAGTLPLRAESVGTGGLAGVTVSVPGRRLTNRLGIRGVVVSLASAGGSGQARVALSYAGFGGKYGGAWSSRLHLVELPGCALTEPQLAACRRMAAVATVNDASSRTLSAVVSLGGQSSGFRPAGATQAGSALGGMVLAAVSGPSGPGGDFTATPLRPSGTWAVQQGAFTYTYPVTVPPALGGAAPPVGLSYDSQSVDSETSGSNTQGGSIGDGWDYSPGFIERSYQPCQQDGIANSGDLCWGGDNAMLSLGAHSSALVKDDSTGGWHLQKDDGTKVQLLSGASNGLWNGEYWRVTTTDGTQYYFGQNHLPGGNGSDSATNSAWGEPVYNPGSGDPCYDSSKGQASQCQMGWRWNLDFVVDPMKHLTVYNYTTESNYYDRGYGQNNGNGTLTQYVRGGYPTSASYGYLLADAIAGAKPAAQVLFGYSDRCLSSQSTCDANHTATYWPDVPWDQSCASSGSCTNYSPTFWSTQRLTSIATQVLEAGSYKPVDSWALAQAFPTGAGSNPVIELTGITRTGQDGGSITMPPLSFSSTEFDNRVDGLVPAAPPVDRPRITGLTTEAGASISVIYFGAACSRVNNTMPANAYSNTMPCFPVNWTPPGQGQINDWFIKSLVRQVNVSDQTVAASPAQVTNYAYLGNAAWHYDNNPLVKASNRTWDQYRGYQQVQTTTGVAPDPVTQVIQTYMQGMDGDNNGTGGTRSVQVHDPAGDPGVTDSNWLSGQVIETDTYTQAGGSIVKRDVSGPWGYTQTASQAQSGGLPALTAHLMSSSQDRSMSLFTGGNWRTSQATTYFNGSGQPVAVDKAPYGSPETCTATRYADPPGGNAMMESYPDQVTAVTGSYSGGSCPAPSSTNIVTDSKIYYDDPASTLTSMGTLGALAYPGGLVTGTQEAVSWTSGENWRAQSATSYDQLGRVTAATTPTPNGATGTATTTTTYTPAYSAGATTELPTNIKVTAPSPFSWTTSTSLDQGRELPLTVTDANGEVTTEAYDALGRLTSVITPPDQASGDKSLTFAYSENGTSPPAVTTSTLRENGSYSTDVKIYDGMLQLRQEQATPANAGAGRVITDTFPDSHGWTVKTRSPYYDQTTAPGTTIWQAGDGSIPGWTATTYDGMGRVTASAFNSGNTRQWQTTTAYPGLNETDVTPPAGGTSTSTFTNVLGQVTSSWKYTTAAADGNAAHADVTSYTYNAAGETATITDNAGNAWTYAYDLAGEKTSATDPGTTAASAWTYDNAGNAATSTDPRGQQLSYQYDLLGRKTAEYSGSLTGTLLASWTYDTALLNSGPAKALGYLASATSYDSAGGASGGPYTESVTGYTSAYKPTGTSTSVPAKDLVPGSTGTDTFTTTNTYAPLTGLLASTKYSADFGLPAETVNYSYNLNGLLTASGGSTAYLDNAVYDALGQIQRTTFGLYGKQLVQTYTRDPGTNWLTSATTSLQTLTSAADSYAYTYNAAGNLTSGTDAQNTGGSQQQCYAYDNLGELTQAWTDTNGTTTAAPPSVTGLGGCVTTTPSASTIGGPSPYWQSFTYDLLGDRTSATFHDTTGNTANDIAQSLTYPGNGTSPASKPDAPVTIVTQRGGSGGPSTTLSAAYDAAGNTTSRNVTASSGSNPPAGPPAQSSFSYNPSGLTSQVTTTAGTSGYTYDASGNLLLQISPAGNTLYLEGGAEQLSYNTAAASVVAQRFYTGPDGTVIVRSYDNSTKTTTVTDETTGTQGTSSEAVSTATQAITRRYYDPYGNSVGSIPSSWPDNHAFLGKPADANTSLDLLGARQYDPATGRFLSLDSLFEAGDPLSMGGYAYARNNPVANADPSGLMFMMDGGGGGGAPPQQQARASSSGGGGCGFLGLSCVAHFTSDFLGGVKDTAVGAVKGVWHTVTLPIQDGIGCLHGSQASCNMFMVDANPMTFGYRLGIQSIKGIFATGKNIYDDFTSGHPGKAIGSIATFAAIILLTKGAGAEADTAAAAEDAGIPAGSTADATTSGSRITPSVRGEYFQGGAEPPTCSYCQQNPAEHLDHVIPRSQGGDLSPENLTPACSWCNLSKGARVAPVNPPPGFVGEWPPSFWPSRMLEWWSSTYGGS